MLTYKQFQDYIARFKRERADAPCGAGKEGCIMSLPSMMVSEQLAGRQMTAFRGLNQAPIRADGELYDMLNLSGALYPVLTVRPARRAETTT